MRQFRIVKYSNENSFYIQEKKWYGWSFVKELRHYYAGDDWEMVTFPYMEGAEAYITKITTPVVEPQLEVIKMITV